MRYLLSDSELLTIALQHLVQEDVPRSDRYPGYPGDLDNSNTFNGIGAWSIDVTSTQRGVAMTDLEQVRTRYQRFANQECRGYPDLYFTLALAVADDEELLKFLVGMPDIQPNLFLASIQYLAGSAGNQ